MRSIENDLEREKRNYWEGPVEFREDTKSEMNFSKEKRKIREAVDGKDNLFGMDMRGEWRRTEY